MSGATPIRRGRTFDEVLDGARSVFLTDGYAGPASMPSPGAAGVSRTTLHSYSADKRLLFMGVAKCECSLPIEEADISLGDPPDPCAVLRRAAERTLGFFLSDFGQSIFRMCVAGSDRFPEPGREFYETGHERYRTRMIDDLRGAVAGGTLEIEDLELAADQVSELCTSHLFAELMSGIGKTTTTDERKRVVDGAVDQLLARYCT